jgi:hypothetical protein
MLLVAYRNPLIHEVPERLALKELHVQHGKYPREVRSPVPVVIANHLNDVFVALENN